MEAIDYTKKLVSCDSASSRPNTPVTDYIDQILQELGYGGAAEVARRR